MVVNASTCEGCQLVVEQPETLEQLSQLYFALCLGDVIIAFEAYAFGHVGIQLLERVDARHPEHLLDFFLGMREIFKHRLFVLVV